MEKFDAFAINVFQVMQNLDHLSETKMFEITLHGAVCVYRRAEWPFPTPSC